MKALAILRVSTKGQRIDDQKEELISFMRGLGYDEIIPIEAVGASAIKMDQKYMELVQRVKDEILKDKDIKAACVWELSRLGRNEVILFEFKEFFIKHKIQFICKQPYMRLLEDDGSVNAGMELAFSLFATMSKQEMEEKKARFKRAKTAMASKGKYIGGPSIKYGYKVVDGFFVEDESEGQIVKMIFDMYSTGKHSTYTLARELEERGYHISFDKIGKILRCKAYTGEPLKGKIEVRYPQIISRDLFDKCQTIRKNNILVMKRGEKITLGAKLVRCPECGAVCTSNSRHYVCCRHFKKGPCSNGFGLRQSVVDNLLWRTAYELHMQYLMDADAGRMDEYREELKIVEEKIAAAKKKMEDFTQKKERIVESFLDLMIDRKTRDLRLKKLQDEVSVQSDNLSSLEDKKRAIMGLLETGEKDTLSVFEKSLEKMELEDKYEVVHRHIESLVGERVSFGVRDRRSKGPNAVRIKITSVQGQEYLYMYVPRLYEGTNLYVYNGREWVRDFI